MINSLELLQHISRNYGNSFFVFDINQLRENFIKLQKSFSNKYRKIEIAYSYKTNYMPSLLQTLHKLGAKAEVVSEMEYELALMMKVEGKNIIFNGPIKSSRALELAIRDGAQIHVDSMTELEEIIELSQRINFGRRTINIGIRCNLDNPNATDSRFGIDVSSKDFSNIFLLFKDYPDLKLKGLHCHLPDRDLDSVETRVNELIKISKSCFDGAPEFLDIGGGFYGENLPFSKFGSEIPSFEDYASKISSLMNAAYPDSKLQPRLILEPGTALVANCFTYWTKVITTKSVKMGHLAVVDGSIQELNPNRRLARAPSSHLSPSRNQKDQAKNWDIVGYTCIEDDFLARNYVADLQPGDFLGFSHAGSYSIVMKPPFIRPASPILGFEDEKETIIVYRDRQELEELLNSFNFEGKKA